MGGIHMWCEFKRDIDEILLLEESIKERVIFAPGSILGTRKRCIRITYGRATEEQIHQGVRHLFHAYEKIK